MTLAARCISCGTTFRVVQDQLRVSDGWVRCGRCDKVFDALDNLIDLDPPSAAVPPVRGRESRVDPPTPGSEAAPIDIRDLLERRDQQALEKPAHPAPPSNSASNLGTSPAIRTEQPVPESAGETPATAALTASAPDRDPRPLPAEPDDTATPTAVRSSPGAAAAAPSFMRVDDPHARWNTPAMRVALIGSSLILLLMLVMQVVYQQRDSIAAHSPAAASALRSACDRWNCRIEPLRRLADLSIESSALSKIAGQPGSVELTMSLRNRGDLALTMPAVELSLTDAQGQLIARKALLPQDFEVDPPLVEAAAALPLRLVLSASGTRIAGYTVELFYP